MRGIGMGKGILWTCGLAGAALAQPATTLAQSAPNTRPTTAQENTPQMDPASVGKLLQQLQSQVQELSGQVKSLKAEQQSAHAESAELRKELDATKSQLVALSAQPGGVAPSQLAPSGGAQAQTSTEERISRLEENQQLADGKAAEQSQTKVESGSKYRLRLSGIVLFNMYADRGSVDNQDFPELATPRNPLSSGNSFGARCVNRRSTCKDLVQQSAERAQARKCSLILPADFRMRQTEYRSGSCAFEQGRFGLIGRTHR